MYSIFTELLKSKGCKVSDVARATQISHVTFTDWKKGRSVPKADKLQKIADYFGVSVDYLMTGKEPEGQQGGVLVLSDPEQLLLAAFRQLNEQGQQKAQELVKLLLLDPANKPQRDPKPASVETMARAQ